MQHFTTWTASSTFVCGADAVGRRNSRLDVNPTLTTCARCKATEAWIEAEIIWAADHTELPAIEDVRGCSCGMADYGAPGHDGDPATT